MPDVDQVKMMAAMRQSDFLQRCERNFVAENSRFLCAVHDFRNIVRLDNGTESGAQALLLRPTPVVPEEHVTGRYPMAYAARWIFTEFVQAEIRIQQSPDRELADSDAPDQINLPGPQVAAIRTRLLNNDIDLRIFDDAETTIAQLLSRNLQLWR